MNILKFIFLLFFLTLGLLFTGCPPATTVTEPPGPTPDPVTETITGNVYDEITGDPVSGITVSLDNEQDTTDASGNFSISISKSPVGGKIIASLGVYGTGYLFKYYEDVEIDTETTYDLSIPVLKDSAYDSFEITGNIFYSNGTTEIPMFSSITLYIFNGKGKDTVYPIYTSNYLTWTSTYGPNCLIVGYVVPSDDSTPFFFIKKNVDIQSDITLDITQPNPSSTSVTLNFAEAGNYAYGYYSVPGYGQIPITCYSTYMANTVLSDDTTPIYSDNQNMTINLYNPEGWQAFWIQEQKDDLFSMNYPSSEKYYKSCGSVAAIGSSVTLPVVNTTFGPAGEPDPDSLSYSGGTLSQTPVTSCDTFVYDVKINMGSSIGTIVSKGASITIPTWVYSLLNGHSIDFSYTLKSGISCDISNIEAHNSFKPGNNFGEVADFGGEYSKVINF